MWIKSFEVRGIFGSASCDLVSIVCAPLRSRFWMILILSLLSDRFCMITSMYSLSFDTRSCFAIGLRDALGRTSDEWRPSAALFLDYLMLSRALWLFLISTWSIWDLTNSFCCGACDFNIEFNPNRFLFCWNTTLGIFISTFSTNFGA